MASVVDIARGVGPSFLDEDKPPLVLPQKYELAFVDYQTAILFGRAPKLILWFRIVTMGKAFETVLPRYYNVRRLIGRPRKNGDFRVGWKSEFLLEYASLFGMPTRLDRFAMTNYERHVIEGKVRTVTTNLKQRDLPKDLQYSVIDQLIRVKTL